MERETRKRIREIIAIIIIRVLLLLVRVAISRIQPPVLQRLHSNHLLYDVDL